MRRLAPLLALALLLALPHLASPAQAWLPVCKEVEKQVGAYAYVHARLDCQPGVTAAVCPPAAAKCLVIERDVLP